MTCQAEELIQKWEDELGPLKNLKCDLYGPGGRLEGVKKIADGKRRSFYEKDDVSASLCYEKMILIPEYQGGKVCMGS